MWSRMKSHIDFLSSRASKHPQTVAMAIDLLGHSSRAGAGKDQPLILIGGFARVLEQCQTVDAAHSLEALTWVKITA